MRMHLSVSIGAHMYPQRSAVQKAFGMELWVVVSCQIWVFATEFWSFGKAVCVVTHRPICLIHIETWPGFWPSIFYRRSKSGLSACKADIFQAEISPHLSHMSFSVYHFTLFSLDYSMLVHGAVPVVMYVVMKRMNQDYECQRSLHSAEGLQWVPTAAFIFSITRNIKQPRDTYRVSRPRIFCLQV